MGIINIFFRLSSITRKKGTQNNPPPKNNLENSKRLHITPHTCFPFFKPSFSNRLVCKKLSTFFLNSLLFSIFTAKLKNEDYNYECRNKQSLRL